MKARSYRHMVDITPWDKGGNSWMGLKRAQAKILATIFLLSGLALADPPFSILPTDFLNIWISGLMHTYLGFDMTVALVVTYTIIAWGLILLGAWIYPYNTSSLISSYLNKFKKLIKKVINNPLLLIVSLIAFYFVFRWYQGVI